MGLLGLRGVTQNEKGLFGACPRGADPPPRELPEPGRERHHAAEKQRRVAGYRIFRRTCRPSSPKDPTTVASYDVLGSGPGSASFQELGITAATVTIDSLEPGDWGVTVNGNNFNGLQVESASVLVTVVEGETASTKVAMSSSAENGTLDAYAEWPTSKTVSGLKAALTPQGGVPQEISLPAVAIAIDISSVHATAQFPAGYYTLSVSYQDADGFTWGGAKAVHISAGGTTKLVFTPFDAVKKMTVDPDVSNSETFTFNGYKDNLGVTGEMTITWTSTQMFPVKGTFYSWYMNGVPINGAAASTITIKASDYGKGNYRLDVVVSANGVLSSGKVVFTIAGG